MPTSRSAAIASRSSPLVFDLPTFSITVSNIDSMFQRFFLILVHLIFLPYLFVQEHHPNHMTVDLNIFSSTSPFTHIPNIYTADGSHMHVSQVGQVSISQVSLPNTYHVPVLSLNLIYVR